jgi:hypothetical protein
MPGSTASFGVNVSPEASEVVTVPISVIVIGVAAAGSASAARTGSVSANAAKAIVYLISLFPLLAAALTDEEWEAPTLWRARHCRPTHSEKRETDKFDDCFYGHRHTDNELDLTILRQGATDASRPSLYHRPCQGLCLSCNR